MEDFQTDREEAYFENEMTDLVKHLEDEYKKSARGNWNKLRQLILNRYFTQSYSSPPPVKTMGAFLTPNSNTEISHISQRQRPPTPPLVQRTVIHVGSPRESMNSGYNHSKSIREETRPKSPTKVKFSSG